MEPFENTAPLGEAELDRLEELLDAEILQGRAMRLDELQGLLCAVISAPEPISPSIWIPAVLGEDLPLVEAEWMDETMGLLMHFYNDMAAILYRGEEPALILYPTDDDDDLSDYGAWADGYLYGSHLGDGEWLDMAGEHAADLSELLENFFLLNGALKEDVLKHGESWMSDAAEEQAMARAADNLPGLVLAIHEFWLALRTPAAPHKRDAPKVGRNETCPCGSGKKFKQCCGDPKKLH